MEDRIIIDGTSYIREDLVLEAAEVEDGMPYVMCRTESAGVFAGYLYSRNGKEVVLKRARRIWYWEGAASLSQLATTGTSNPNGCLFPCEVSEVTLLEVIEIIPITAQAKAIIDEVPVWEM